MNQWQIGKVRITRVVEMQVTGGSRFILPDATREACLPIEWLAPHFMDDKGNLIMSIHALVIDTGTASNHCRHLHRQRQRALDSELVQSADQLPQRPGGRRLSPGEHRYRALHPSARRSCRLEHHAGGR